MDNKIAVIVTTEHRGVFFGWINPADQECRDRIRIENVRNVIYWTSDTGGFLGLAASGPGENSRVGKQAAYTWLHGITSVTACTDKAVEVFDAIDS